jgi:hypothetical protein
VTSNWRSRPKAEIATDRFGDLQFGIEMNHYS